MISALLIVLAAVSKAVADTLAHHFPSSVFRGLNPAFWNPEQSWRAPLFPGTKYRVDAWHLANSAMIIFFCAAVVLHRPLLWWGWELLVAGALFILSFNLFYNKILR